MGPWNQEKQLLERDDFTVKIMKSIPKVNLINLKYLFCVQNGVEFELGFKDPKLRLDFWQWLEADKGNLYMKGTEFVRGHKRGKKLITVQMYTTQIKEIDEFLA